VEERAEKDIEELQRKPSLASHHFPFLFIDDEKLRVVVATTLCVEYRHQSQAQFQVLMEQVKKQEDEIEAITAGIGPVLDNIGLPQPEGAWLPEDGPYQSMINHYRDVWSNFRKFARCVAHGDVIHALAQLRSHYPTVDLQRVATGYAQGTDAQKITKLEEEVEEPAKRLAKDVELFGNGEGSAP
jgi:hypothetical protein